MTAAAALETQPTTLSLCWCGSTSVEIPISWVGTNTSSCDHPECTQGCDLVEIDAFDLTEDNVGLILELGTGLCVCGCGEPVNVAKRRRFRPGHDGRTKGWIAKAGREGKLIAIYESDTETVCTAADALDYFGWPAYK